MKPASIALCLSADKTHFLAVKRKDVPIWVLPGGGIDDHESPEQAAARELYEETALACHKTHLRATYHPRNRLSATTYIVECFVDSITLLAPQEETSSVGFFPIDAPPSPFFFLHEEWLHELVQQNVYFEKDITSITWKRLVCEICRHPWMMFRYLMSRIGLPINQ